MKKKVKEKSYVLLKERIDFINVVGDSSHINHSTDFGYQKLKDYFCLRHGFDYERSRKDVRFYSPKGSRTIVVEFTRNRQNASPIIKVKFPGSFLYGCQAEREKEIRSFIETVWTDLGIESLPYTNEFDIALDTLGATFEEIGIDLNSPKWIMKTTKNSRFKYQVHPHHNNLDDHCEKTGQTVLATRFKIRWYDRIMALEQKYNKEEYAEYRAYYNELYNSFNRVMREEVKLKKELCSLFNVLFWGSKNSFDETLPQCLSLFIKSHKFINTKTGKTNKRIEENFYLDKNTSLKRLKTDLGEGESKNLYTLKYSAPKYNKNILIKKLAKAQLKEGKGLFQSVNEIVQYVQSNMEFLIEEEIEALTKCYQTNLLLAGDDSKKRQSIIERFLLDKMKWIQIRNSLKAEVKAKKEQAQ